MSLTREQEQVKDFLFRAFRKDITKPSKSQEIRENLKNLSLTYYNDDIKDVLNIVNSAMAHENELTVLSQLVGAEKPIGDWREMVVWEEVFKEYPVAIDILDFTKELYPEYYY